MPSATAPQPRRGRSLGRLLADLDALEELTGADRTTAVERLHEELGDELAHKLLFALTSSGRAAQDVAA